eukprot:917166_1
MENEILLIVLVIILAIILLTYELTTRSILQRLSVFLPAATFYIVLGILFGGFLELALQDRSEFQFSSNLFFVFLLPPIILGAGFSVRKDIFFHNFGAILSFAFIGTFITAIIISSLVYVVGRLAGVYELSLANSFVLGSLLAAVDPVSTVIVLKSLRVDPELDVLITGESVLNDAVAIVINQVFVSIANHTESDTDIPMAMGKIIWVSILSIALGLAVGFLSAFLFRVSSFGKVLNLEVGLFLILAFIPYQLAETIGLSGIMAMLFSAFVADYYTACNLSSGAETIVREMVQLIAFLAESFVFVCLGMSILLLKPHRFEFGLIAFCLIFCVLSRAVSTFGIAGILNLFRKKPIPISFQSVMVLASLRGPVAFALAVTVAQQRDVIVTTTLAVAIFTTVVFGGATHPFVKRLGISTGGPSTETIDNKKLFDVSGEELSVQTPPKEVAVFSGMDVEAEDYGQSNHWFNRLDKMFLGKYFRRNPFPPHRQSTASLADSASAAIILGDVSSDQI